MYIRSGFILSGFLNFLYRFMILHTELHNASKRKQSCYKIEPHLIIPARRNRVLINTLSRHGEHNSVRAVTEHVPTGLALLA